ncbi:mitochondrial ribosomal protein S15 [Russula emetica]|nr:mitochondrial ribosomal protein S15 [Russula emetica]
MFRVQAAATRAAVAATTLTSSSSSSSRAPLHTTSVLSAESARKRHARLTRQKNLAKREELQKKAAASRPHVILGTVARDEDEASAKWAACDLAKVLVHPEELAPDAPVKRFFSLHDTMTAQEGGNVRVPSSLAFGIREREERMLFEHLPLLSADMSTRHKMTVMTNNSLSGGGGGGSGANGHQRKGVEVISAYHEMQLAAGVTQANVLAKMVDLRNANAAGIAFENRRRVIEAFSEPGKPNDSGRTEVQAALLTLQVRNVWNHLREFKRDVANRRSLRRLVHQRAKLLKYLKRTDRDRYERVLERLGLEPGAVEGELLV